MGTSVILKGGHRILYIGKLLWALLKPLYTCGLTNDIDRSSCGMAFCSGLVGEGMASSL